MKAQHIKADGTTLEVVPSNGTNFSLAELQAFVGGYIERVECPDGREMYCNEEGKLQNLPVNTIATKLSGLFPYDLVVGDVVVGDYKLFRDPEELEDEA